MQYFLACNGSWSVVDGSPKCLGTLKSVTSEEITLITNQGLTLENANDLLVPTLKLFAIVFVILLFKKVLTQR